MRALFSLAVAVVMTALTALSGVAADKTDSAENTDKVVTLYSSRYTAMDEELYKDFTKLTGIRVKVVQARGSDLIQRIHDEGKNSPADVFLTEDAGVIGRVHHAGLLQPVKSAALEAAIPAHLREAEGHWFGVTMRARVIIYHKDRVKRSELSTYEDLATAKWRKRILVRSSASAHNQSLVVSMMESDGVAKTELWAKGVVANMARDPQGDDSDQIVAVMAGEGDIAISNTYYLGRLLKQGKPGEYDRLGVFFPNQHDRGTHVNISGGGVLKHAPNRDNAVTFLEFLLTPEAQKVFAEANFEYPVRKGADVAPAVKTFGDFKADPLNVGVLARRNQEAVHLLDRAGWK